MAWAEQDCLRQRGQDTELAYWGLSAFRISESFPVPAICCADGFQVHNCSQ